MRPNLTTTIMLPIQQIKNSLKALAGLSNSPYAEGDISQYTLSAADQERLSNEHSFTQGTVQLSGISTRYTHGASMLHSWQEIFADEVYRFIPNNSRPYIIDGGANIGLSTLYFALRHPQSRIDAYEADPHIFQVLQQNIAAHRSQLQARIQLHQQALWHSDTQLTFHEEGALAGSVVGDFGRTGNTQTVPAINIGRLLQQRVDLLKLDIEGAENELLPTLKPVLTNIDYLFVEYHSLQEQPQQLGQLLLLLSNAGFRYHIREAAKLAPYPMEEKLSVRRLFDLQLNIWCYRP